MHISVRARGQQLPRKERSRRTWIALTVAATTALLALVIPSTTAQAAPLTVVTCTGSETQTFSPGLTNTTSPFTLTRTDDYSSCTHVVGTTITSMSAGFGPVATTVAGSCDQLLQTAPGSHLITWSDGSTSDFSFTRTATSIAGTVVLTRTGTITSGLYAGAVAVETATFVGLNGLAACSTQEGLTSLDGTVLLTITQL